MLWVKCLTEIWGPMFRIFRPCAWNSQLVLPRQTDIGYEQF